MTRNKTCSCVLLTIDIVRFTYADKVSPEHADDNFVLYYRTFVVFLYTTLYITDFVFCHRPLSDRLSSLNSYYIPRDGPQSSYKEYIRMLPSTEHPEVFGQHSNADIASQIAETRTLFDTLLSLQPRVTSPTAAGSGPSREDKVTGEAKWEEGRARITC